MKKVLVFGMTENPGGIESFLRNYYYHIDRERLQFDFLCNSFEPIAYEKEFESLGAKMIHFPARSKNPAGFRKALKAFFAKHAGEYEAIWVNVCSLANIDYLKLAKKYGISRRIIHSHNSENMDSGWKGKLRGKLHAVNKKKIGALATDYWACAKEAADWFYPEEIRDQAVIIHNAIDLKKFAFDEGKRKNYRNVLRVKNQLVVGNIGRLHFQKNQSFLLEVFAKLLRIEPDAVLVLIGKGEDEAELKEKAHTLGIEDHVNFMGLQYDIGGWFSAFDMFVFPSLFEGASVVALEAQASGIPTLASEGTIPEEILFSGNFVTYSLERKPVEWVGKISEIYEKKQRLLTPDIVTMFTDNGYNIETEAVKLQKLLLGE